MLGEFIQGVQNISKADNLRGSLSLPGEFAHLTRRVVQEDKVLIGLSQKFSVNDVWFYTQRLLELGFIFREIFIRQEYQWRPDSQTPRIIDLGGDFGGISVLYWKSLAPQARVTLVEANPATATVVAENIRKRGIKDIQIINAAVSGSDGYASLHLHRPGIGYHASDFIGQRINLDMSLYQTVSVPKLKVSSLVGDEKVDLLKMDIEGVEGDVIQDLMESDKLGLINEIIMEFHNDPTNPSNSLTEVLRTLRDAGFFIERAQKSGRTRRSKTEFIDLDSVEPYDKKLITLQARRS